MYYLKQTLVSLTEKLLRHLSDRLIFLTQSGNRLRAACVVRCSCPCIVRASCPCIVRASCPCVVRVSCPCVVRVLCSCVVLVSCSCPCVISLFAVQSCLVLSSPHVVAKRTATSLVCASCSCAHYSFQCIILFVLSSLHCGTWSKKNENNFELIVKINNSTKSFFRRMHTERSENKLSSFMHQLLGFSILADTNFYDYIV